MSSISFEADPLSWKVTRFFLLLQIAGLIVVVGLCLRNHYFLALTISLLTLFAFFAVLLWLYSRYLELPLVREKRELERLAYKFQKGNQSETQIIQAAIRQREVLFQAEKDEIHRALETLQRDHLENGLTAARVSDATIPGIGPRLKERLAGYGVVSAAQVTEKTSRLPGFGETKHQALMNWRVSVVARLESTRPHALPHEQLEAIKQKYQSLQDQNDAAERKARASKQLLEHELTSFQPRIQHLAPLTFFNYLSRSLASRGAVAALLALLLIGSQVISSVSALTSTASSLLASIPFISTTPSPTETMTQAPTATPTDAPTATLTVTRPSSPTPAASTFTATVLPSPSQAQSGTLRSPPNTPMSP